MVVLFGYIERGIFSLFQPSYANQQKTHKDKRVITDFRHLNVRIAKTNLACPLLKDTFSVLGGKGGCSSVCVTSTFPTFIWFVVRLQSAILNLEAILNLILCNAILWAMCPKSLVAQLAVILNKGVGPSSQITTVRLGF